jgi:energy-coupling factor transport system ATP-binding protein
MVGLNLPLDHATSSLSGGQKQRLALAGVLAMQPSLLLLDEPTANLDPEGVREVRESVGRVLAHTECTFIVIEHRVKIWQDLVNRVIVLGADGGVLADGTPGEVLMAESLALTEAGIWVPGIAHSLHARPPRPAPHTALLHTENLTIVRARDVIVAEKIELIVPEASAVLITGANGAGKSTLALTLAGLLQPGAGRVVASSALAGGAGTDPIRWKSRQLLSRVGTVFQDPEHQFVAGTVRGELAVGPKALGLSPVLVQSRVDDLLGRLRLDHLAEANPFTLSGGEKRRLSVATVLATQPQLLVLDEPTFGQDFRTWQEIVALLHELIDAGTTVVAVSHDSEFVDAVADYDFHLNGHDAPHTVRTVRS